MCYCEHCRENFKKFSGSTCLFRRTRSILRAGNTSCGVRRGSSSYGQFGTRRSRSVNPNASFIANAGGGALSDLDMKTIGKLAPTLFADRQARQGLMPPWANGKNGKEYAATMGRKPIVGIFSVGVEENYRWKDSVQSADEIRMWVVDGIAHNLRPGSRNSTASNRPSLAACCRGIVWLALSQRALLAERKVARACGDRVFAADGDVLWRRAGGAMVEDHALGFYQALVEARIPFDMVHDHLLDAAHIDRYRTLILPNIAALSTAQCKQLAEYVERGGNLRRDL